MLIFLIFLAGLVVGFFAGLRVGHQPRPPEPRGHLALTLGPVHERTNLKGDSE